MESINNETQVDSANTSSAPELDDYDAEKALYLYYMEYLCDELNLTVEEAEPIAHNWARQTPQTEDEIREGIIAERLRRLASYDDSNEQ